jgi:hypothetical protein
MSNGCCEELEAKLQALGIFDAPPTPPPSIVWTLATAAANLASKAKGGPFLVVHHKSC